MHGALEVSSSSLPRWLFRASKTRSFPFLHSWRTRDEAPRSLRERLVTFLVWRLKSVLLKFSTFSSDIFPDSLISHEFRSTNWQVLFWNLHMLKQFAFRSYNVTNKNVQPTHTLTDDRLEASWQFSPCINDTPRSRGVTFLVTAQFILAKTGDVFCLKLVKMLSPLWKQRWRVESVSLPWYVPRLRWGRGFSHPTSIFGKYLFGRRFAI